jgi:hypothetical protein
MNGLEIDAAWQAEIEKRVNEIDSGAVRCIRWEDIRDGLFNNARKSLRNTARLDPPEHESG